MDESDPEEKLLRVTSELFDTLGAVSLSRISSRKNSGRDTRESLLTKYADVPRQDLLEALVTAELVNMDLEDENYALVDQVNQSNRDLVDLQSEITRLKKSHAKRIKELEASEAKYKSLAAKWESEIIFLEDHARFSAEQTKLSIQHWDLLLKNRDENIELMTNRINVLTSEQRTNTEVTLDKYNCLRERLKALAPEGEGEDPAECPWRKQADVRVSQLERVTAQLNATYDQLHRKSDELLLQNREIGNLRRKSFEAETKLRKYRLRINRLNEQLRRANVSPAETSSIHSSE